MQHLDEGTIHTWLDGELSESESDAATRHVAECAKCAALVAEARGVIAGAARIVAALDAGPAGVIPKSPPSNAQKTTGFWRRFASSPSRMALAATILVAVGVTLTVRRAPREGAAARSPIGETPPALSAPAVTPPAAPSASSAPAQIASPTAELKDRAGRTALNEPSPAAAPKASVSHDAGFVSGPTKQSAPAGAAATTVADRALADKKKDADLHRDRPEAAKPLAEVRPQFQAAPVAAPVRADSGGLRQQLVKVAADSIAARPAPPVVRQVEAASGSPMRRAAAQAQNSRAATLDVMSEASLQGCYRVSVDASAWRGVLPASFELAGSPVRSPIAAGGGQGAAPQDVARRATNAVQAFSAKPNPVSYGVHVIGPNGQPDSTAIGDWTIVEPMSARVRFATVDQGRPVTVLISGASPFARVMAGDRTDSLRITRIVCQR